MREDEIIRAAIDEFGAANQVGMFHEEAGELLSAINKFKRGRVGIDSVCEEIADLQIMCEQMAVIFDEVKVAEQKKYKLERLEKKVMEHRLKRKKIIFFPLRMRDEAEKFIKEIKSYKW